MVVLNLIVRDISVFHELGILKFFALQVVLQSAIVSGLDFKLSLRHLD